ncbi:THAP domain containing protein 5 [Dissostichus eleginoides]|uniref:THAP domain-containing protein 5 n=1 Tax=Dissostichus eleginoides TaxID=100907 RepID=A0AAD9FPH2_DISEL|nr:THAP domain containing protein 5 [Dissostichus eleginoides]
MPRYCAVKMCRNRGGTTPRPHNKRISFYPFPLQDKSRLQKWVDNMKREEWAPSRHQYLCSEHFTEDCFDIRWGIRYLKNTAIPTEFPSSGDDAEKKVTTIKRSPKAKRKTLDIDTETKGFDSPLSTKPLILSRTCKKVQSNTTSGIEAEHTGMIFESPLVSDTCISCPSNETQTAAGELPGDSGMPKASCLTLSRCDEPHPEEQAPSIVTVLCCESLGPFSEGEEHVDAAALQTALGQAFSFVPVEIAGHGQGSAVAKDLSLHAKILELDEREVSTMDKIRALETEVALLKKDGGVFKEKQNILEDYISSMLL